MISGRYVSWACIKIVICLPNDSVQIKLSEVSSQKQNKSLIFVDYCSLSKLVRCLLNIPAALH